MKFIAVIGFFLISVTFVQAQSSTSTFNIRVFGGVDTIAPSTPTLLLATPVAPNQVNISWSTATDNFFIQGYVVTRGTTTIATTTLTSFSDTSVFASSTYMYSVRAFDAAFNYSSSSNSLSVTTPDVPAIQEQGSSQGTVARTVIRDFSISPGLSTSDIEFNTARPVQVTLRWGRTSSYELGYLVNEVYSRDHAIVLTDLEPGTTYEYEIITQSPSGRLDSVVKSGQFTTLAQVVPFSPSNVARFLASADGSDVRLSWQEPVGEAVAYVRIVRSHLGFPSHPQDGAVVYQGQGTSFTDVDILSVFSPVYYTAFTYSPEGKVSSGAIALVYAASAAGEQEGAFGQGVESEIGKPIRVEVATSTVNTERFTAEMKIPELSEVYVRQAEQEFSFIAQQLTLDSEQSFTVAVPAWAVAGNLKSIIGTLVDPTDNRKRYSFLLRINQDQTAYETEIAALSVEGESALIVELYDYEAAIVATYQAPIVFVATQTQAEEVVFPDAVLKNSNWLLLAAVIPFICALILLLIYRHRTEDNDE